MPFREVTNVTTTIPLRRVQQLHGCLSQTPTPTTITNWEVYGTPYNDDAHFGCGMFCSLFVWLCVCGKTSGMLIELKIETTTKKGYLHIMKSIVYT